MTPYEQAARWHMERSEVPFRFVLEAHLFHGHVICGPDKFVLGRQVCRDWPAARLLDPWDSDEHGDAWFVWLWAGEIGDWRAVLPWLLPWLMWERGGRMRCFPLREMVRAREVGASCVTYGQQTEDPTAAAAAATGTSSAHDGR